MAAKKPPSNKTAKYKASPGDARLRGKVAVVTGGSRGIGCAIAGTLALEGCSVVIAARNPAGLKLAATQIAKFLKAQQPPTEVVPIACDVRDQASVTALFAEVKKRFDRVDILVSNAGITQPVLGVAQTSLELWRDVIDTNLTGVFLCTRAALPLMKAGATIVNNLSAAARQVFPNYATYSAAKRGALGFTLSLREELIPRGIRVMALMTGATATDMWDQIMPNAPRDRMIDVNSVAQAVLYAALLPPNVNPSEISLDPTSGAL
jgi:NAD(P)-dependent dehydrogenase (short-subunit alcohol dehydrogenase family)